MTPAATRIEASLAQPSVAELLAHGRGLAARAEDEGAKRALSRCPQARSHFAGDAAGTVAPRFAQRTPLGGDHLLPPGDLLPPRGAGRARQPRRAADRVRRVRGGAGGVRDGARSRSGPAGRAPGHGPRAHGARRSRRRRTPTGAGASPKAGWRRSLIAAPGRRFRCCCWSPPRAATSRPARSSTTPSSRSPSSMPRATIRAVRSRGTRSSSTRSAMRTSAPPRWRRRPRWSPGRPRR